MPLYGGTGFDLDYTRDYALNTSPSCFTVIKSASGFESQSGAWAMSIYSVNEQLDRLVAFLGMSKSDLARIFSVSRPALYAWLSGESVPQGINAERISQLHALLEKVHWDGKHSLFHGFTSDLMQALSGPSFDSASVAVMFDSIWKKTAERLDRISAVPLSAGHSGDIRTLDDNLLALGTEG